MYYASASTPFPQATVIATFVFGLCTNAERTSISIYYYGNSYIPLMYHNYIMILFICQRNIANLFDILFNLVYYGIILNYLGVVYVKSCTTTERQV